MGKVVMITVVVCVGVGGSPDGYHRPSVAECGRSGGGALRGPAQALRQLVVALSTTWAGWLYSVATYKTQQGHKITSNSMTLRSDI